MAKAVLPYSRRPTSESAMLPPTTVPNMAVVLHYLGPGAESMTFDMLAGLARVQCPTSYSVAKRIR